MPGVELATLFGADLPEVSASRMGIRMAGGAKVSIRDLASTLLAMSVAELLSGQAATLQQRETKKLFRTSTVLVLDSGGTGDGFAGRVSAAARGGVPVSQLALRMLGSQVLTPDLMIIAMAQSVLEPTGAVVARQGKSKIAAKTGFSSIYEINEQAAEALRAQWPPVRQGWETWKAANQGLAGPLGDACRKAMSEAKEVVE